MSGRLVSIMASSKPLITFLIDDELLQRLDDFRFGYRMASRGEAIRFLLTAALDQHPTPEPVTPPTDSKPPRPGKRAGPVLPRATDQP